MLPRIVRMQENLSVFINGLHEIASNDCEIDPLHERTRHFARCALAMLDSPYCTTLQKSSMTQEEHSTVRYWLTVITVNGLTCSDRAIAAGYILDIYLPKKQLNPGKPSSSTNSFLGI